MNEPTKSPALLSDALRAEIKQLILEALREVNGNGHREVKPPDAPDPYITVGEAAKLSRLASSTIRLYIRKRELRACQVGSRVIIKRTDLEKFLEAHPIEILSD